MPPRLSIWGAMRSLPSRMGPQASQLQPSRIAAMTRHYADDANPSNPQSAASDSSIPHIPASMFRPGEQTQSDPPSKEEDVQMRDLTPNEAAINQLQQAAFGLKFEEPPMPMDKLQHAKYHMKYRYDEGITQITRLLMRDGKLGKAQNDMAMILNFLRTSPPPRINPQRPLLPGSPPPEHLPLNPNLYLMLAVDSVSPLIRIRGYAGLAGGGKALEVPMPITRRARRRMAWSWIMDTVNKRPSMGSGKRMLAHRIAEEIISVVEGSSSVWDKRQLLHKQGTTVRANLNSSQLIKFKR